MIIGGEDDSSGSSGAAAVLPGGMASLAALAVALLFLGLLVGYLVNRSVALAPFCCVLWLGLD